MESSTESLRKLASTWTLAGDEQLLILLQNTHKRLIEKCQEVNNQLEKMATALDDASISLQNVNNQFMALSNSKFVESRVYEDDADITIDTPIVKESPPSKTPETELASIKQSLSVLENCHEVIPILHDSDTESDTDDDSPARLVLKPKDLYAQRPLPYIIGSEPWKNKWHVGLLVEDSESDSSMGQVDHESDQYSSETEVDEKLPDRLDTTISETSSSLPSELPPHLEPSKPTPSDVASEIARRLGAKEPIQVVPSEPEYIEPPKQSVRKVYRPQVPITSTIFPDEPPPLSSSQEDIFSQLHQPYSHNVADDLFGFNDQQDNIFNDLVKPSDIKPAPVDVTSAPHKLDKNQNIDHQETYTPVSTSADPTDDRGVKKPVGGISLFGSKGTESIGAAILKRNQRKSTSDEDTSDNTEAPENKQTIIKKEKDIFDDLFAKNKAKPNKPVNVIKNITKEIQSKNDENIQKDKVPPKENKVDLFSDNLFDDIDDIFTTNIPKTQKDNKKSIFDENDDLFSDIAVSKSVKTETTSNNNKGLFDSDDELFSENMPKLGIEPDTREINRVTTVDSVKDIKQNQVTSIFDDDDDLFSDVSKSNTKKQHSESTKNSPSNIVNLKPSPIRSLMKSPSLFDENDDDIFAQTTKDVRTNTPTSNKEEDIVKQDINISVAHSENDNILEVNTKITQYTNTETPKTVVEDITVKTNIYNRIIDGTNIAATVVRNAIDTIDEKNSDKNSDDGLSEQDFDDLPPKVIQKQENETNITQKDLETEHESTTSDKNEILKKNTVQEALLSTNQLILETKDNTSNIEPYSQENKTNIVNTVPQDADIFTITEPPVFEKPKEPKRSKNVNALFDDDSDDESLFFKKDDVISDEKPELFSPQDMLFGIFVDEPPDDLNIDIFKSSVIDIEPQNVKSDIFKTKKTNTVPKADETDILKTKQENITSFDKNVVFKDEDKTDIFKQKYEGSLPKSVEVDSDIFTSKLSDKTPTIDESNIFNVKQDEKPTLHKKPVPSLFDIPNFDDVLTENKQKDIQNYNVEKDAPITKKEIFVEKPNLTNNLFLQDSDDETLFKTDANDNTCINKPIIDISKNISTTENSFNKKEDLINDPKRILADDEFSTKSVDYGPKSLDSALFQKPQNKGESSKSYSKDEPKNVGKLKIGLNINVNALLPGASPKKIKQNVDKSPETAVPGMIKPAYIDKPSTVTPKSDESEHIDNNIEISNQSDNTDGQTQSLETKTSEIPSKTVGFNKEMNSEILDNKLSKDRPKIQVKRRPSTRRARIEAVRKSAIDFGDDTTDSNSNDSKIDQSKEKLAKTEYKNDESENIAKNSTKTVEKSIEIENKSNISAENVNVTQGFDEITQKSTKITKKIENSDNHSRGIIDSYEQSTKNRSVTSKIVYILNDEDIFNTNTEKTTANITTDKIDSKKETSDVTIDDNHLGKSTKNNVIDSISTLGYKLESAKNDEKPTLKKEDRSKTSLFGDESDDIFKSKAKTSIFDSDSEEDFFSKNQSKRKEKERKVEVKRSLFDDDEDDDLFGVKKSVESKPSTSMSSSMKETTISSEPVFEDPLSMFDDDD